MSESPVGFGVIRERVALGPLRRELYPLHVAWVNDPDVAWNIFGRHEPRSEAEESAWLERERSKPDARFWLVYRLDEDRPIGVTSLTGIGDPPGTAAFRILIGAGADRRQGFGEAASRLVLDHAFGVLGLNRVTLDVFGYNESARRLYGRLGFREVGRRTDRIHRDGRTWDVIEMALDRALTAGENDGNRAGNGDGDPHDLQRFVDAQHGVMDGVLRELRAGRKTGHWIWFVFPQLAELGRSEMARHYGIRSIEEARAYLAHPVLGERLRECVGALLAIDGSAAEQVLGPVDAMKVRSSMTLFHRAAPEDDLFLSVLAKWYGGVPDPLTDQLLGDAGEP